jgi:hypothetical protein
MEYNNMNKNVLKVAVMSMLLLNTTVFAIRTIDLDTGGLPGDITFVKIPLNNGKLDPGKMYEVSCWFSDAFPFQLYAKLENAKTPYGQYDLELESGYYSHGTADTNPFPFFLSTRGELNISKVTTENKSLTIFTSSSEARTSGNTMYYCYAIDPSSFAQMSNK